MAQDTCLASFVRAILVKVVSCCQAEIWQTDIHRCVMRSRDTQMVLAADNVIWCPTMHVWAKHRWPISAAESYVHCFAGSLHTCSCVNAMPPVMFTLLEPVAQLVNFGQDEGKMVVWSCSLCHLQESMHVPFAFTGSFKCHYSHMIMWVRVSCHWEYRM